MTKTAFGITKTGQPVEKDTLRQGQLEAEIITYVLETTGADPARCIMIGDRQYDILGANAFGMPAVGVLWGYGSREELTEAGAAYLAAHPAEIKEIIDHV